MRGALGTADTFILLSCRSSCISRHAGFSPLVVDPMDTAIMQPHVAVRLHRWSSNRWTPQSSLWPSKYLLTCMQSAINDLSCYTTVQSHCLQNVWLEGVERGAREPDWGHLVSFSTGGMGREASGRTTREGAYVYLWLIPVVWRIHRQIVIILRLKIK